MQRGSEPPILPDATSRFPLLLFSHGYGGSPLSNDYITALAILASYGYIVAAPFHNDWQYNTADLSNFADIVYLIAHLRDYLAMQALRPLTLSATIDLLLNNPQWSARVDPSQIGGFGASLGGESVLLMAGAGLTTSLGLSWTVVDRDPRLKMAVTYVPYFGQPFFPGVRSRPAWPRRHHAAVPRDQRHRRHDGADRDDVPRGFPACRHARARRVERGQARIRHPVDDRHLHLDADLSRRRAAWQSGLQRQAPARDERGRQRRRSRSDPYNGLPSAAVLNFGGLWWAAPAGSEPGRALQLTHQGDIIVATLSTYDLNGNAWWVTMAAVKVAPNTYTGPSTRRAALHSAHRSIRRR
jgi:hypothetical protein